MSKNKYIEGSTSTKQLCKSSNKDFSDITGRMFDEIKETMAQAVSKASSAEERMCRNENTSVGNEECSGYYGEKY